MTNDIDMTCYTLKGSFAGWVLGNFLFPFRFDLLPPLKNIKEKSSDRGSDLFSSFPTSDPTCV